MRKFLLGCLGVFVAMATIQFAQADAQAGWSLFNRFSSCGPCNAASCNPCDAACDTGCDIACDKESAWYMGGSLEAGVYVNEYGRKNQYIGDFYPGYPGRRGFIGDSGNSNYLHNVRQSDFQMNQLYLYGGKKLNARKGFDIGGHVGYMFGTDARYAQSYGLEIDNGGDVEGWGSGDYYSALTEAYVEVGYKRLSAKVGKFFSPMGHEGLVAESRFFYSISDAFAMSPCTQTGVLFNYEVRKNINVFAGWTQGYYSSYTYSQDVCFDTSHNNAFLFGARWDLNDRVYVKYAAMVGRDTSDRDYQYPEAGNKDRDYFVQSFIVGAKLGKHWDYTFEWTMKNDNDEYGYDIGYGKLRWGTYGINNELIYRVNKKWAVGLRAEWTHVYEAYTGYDAQGQAVYRDNDSTDKLALTLGANWTPASWLLVRPEMRYDKFSGRDNYFSGKYVDQNVERNKQFSAGVSAVVMF